ncbi:MAG: uracil-DNA glycosylase [Verrucomicrobia bacterium]|nr:uracil-DNA glycosylase [Verrucomicrobiota bacterium]
MAIADAPESSLAYDGSRTHNPKRTMTDSLNQILGDLATHLEHELDEGARVVPMDRDVVIALTEPVTSTPVVAAPAPAPVAAAPPPEKVAPLPPSDTPGSGGLAELVSQVAACQKCKLCETRTKTVPGQGSATPEIMFVGEAPGHDEDQQGLAFVGKAGQLLTKMIEAMGYTREEIFIGNVLKCRPPNNRTPSPKEMETCLPYLREQIRILQPKVIISLGATALKGLVDVDGGITRLRGKWLSFEGIDLMPTYHPAYLLRSPEFKKDTWEDLQMVLRHLGREIPEVKKRGE